MTANTDLITLVTGDSTHDIREDAWVNEDGWVPPTRRRRVVRARPRLRYTKGFGPFVVQATSLVYILGDTS